MHSKSVVVAQIMYRLSETNFSAARKRYNKVNQPYNAIRTVHFVKSSIFEFDQIPSSKNGTIVIIDQNDLYLFDRIDKFLNSFLDCYIARILDSKENLNISIMDGKLDQAWFVIFPCQTIDKKKKLPKWFSRNNLLLTLDTRYDNCFGRNIRGRKRKKRRGAMQRREAKVVEFLRLLEGGGCNSWW